MSIENFPEWLPTHHRVLLAPAQRAVSTRRLCGWGLLFSNHVTCSTTSQILHVLWRDPVLPLRAQHGLLALIDAPGLLRSHARTIGEGVIWPCRSLLCRQEQMGLEENAAFWLRQDTPLWVWNLGLWRCPVALSFLLFPKEQPPSPCYWLPASSGSSLYLTR